MGVGLGWGGMGGLLDEMEIKPTPIYLRLSQSGRGFVVLQLLTWLGRKNGNKLGLSGAKLSLALAGCRLSSG